MTSFFHNTTTSRQIIFFVSISYMLGLFMDAQHCLLIITAMPFLLVETNKYTYIDILIADETVKATKYCCCFMHHKCSLMVLRTQTPISTGQFPFPFALFLRPAEYLLPWHDKSSRHDLC